MDENVENSALNEHHSNSMILNKPFPIQNIKAKAKRILPEQLQSNSEHLGKYETKNKNTRDRSKTNKFNEIDKKNTPRGREHSLKNKVQDSRYDKNKTKKKNRKDLSINSRPRDKIKDENEEREKTITEILYRRFGQVQSHANTECASHGSTNSTYINQFTNAVETRQPAGTEYDIMSNASIQTQAHEIRQKQLQALNISNKDFIACLNVSKFKPEEIKAKIVNDSVFVEGSHDERLEENGIIARTFSRKYVIPDGYDPTKIQITMYKDKILKIRVPAPAQTTGPIRVIPIQHRNENAIIKKNRPE